MQIVVMDPSGLSYMSVEIDNTHHVKVDLIGLKACGILLCECASDFSGLALKASLTLKIRALFAGHSDPPTQSKLVDSYGRRAKEEEGLGLPYS